MTHIFVSLPTDDVERSKAFYLALGAELKPLFTDEATACFAWDDNVFFMMVAREKFASFTEKPIADPRAVGLVGLSFSQTSRAAVDETLAKGLAAGGVEPTEPQDYGFMYSRDLEDPDGHVLAFFFMEPEAVEAGPEVYLAQQADA